MARHDVDFICGDFDMSGFSTVGDVFTDAEFSAPWGTPTSGELVSLTAYTKTVPAFSSCLVVPTRGEFRNTIAFSLTMTPSGSRPAT